MRSFAYTAADRTGASRKGLLLAPSKTGAVDQLSRLGLFPIRVSEVTGRIRLGPGASRKDLGLVFRSLASLVAIGVPLVESVRATHRIAPPALGAQLEQVVAALQQGRPLATAFLDAGIALPAAAAGMLAAAERGGRLELGLVQIAGSLERDAEVVNRIRQALAYPALLAVIGLFSVGLIVGVVVPRFAALLADLGQKPPFATRLLLLIAAGLQRWGIVVLPAFGAAAVALASWVSRPAGRTTLHGALLRLPVIGPLVHQLGSGRIAETLGQLLLGGVPLLAAIDAGAGVTGNVVIEARLRRAKDRVAHGSPLTQALEAEAAVSDDVVRLVGLGESSGKLGEMLVRAGDLALADAERRLRALVSLLEPGMILGFALLVGLVAAALLQAVYSLRPGVGG
jgi:type II secretory pathway component PulF